MSNYSSLLSELRRPDLLLIPALLGAVLFLRSLPRLRVRLRRRGDSQVDPGLLPRDVLLETEALHPWIGLGYRLAFLAALAGLGFAVATTRWFWGSPTHRLLPVALWALAAVLIAWIELTSPAPWFDPAFRELAWRAARWSGAVRARARDLLVWVLLALPVVALALAYWKKEQYLNKVLSVLVAGLALLLLVAAYRARRRIVIQPFADGEGPLKGLGTEVAARLQHELARIQSLYEVVDEVMPDSSNKSVRVSMSVEDIGAIFKEAVGPSSTLKVFGMEIPIGAIVSALGFFVRGPRITGSLLREVGDDGRGFSLLAEISGGGQSGSWQVNLVETPKAEAKAADEAAAATSVSDAERGEIERLVEELACRIFASLVPSGTPRWQAVQHFTEGLRAYRETQRSHRGRTFHLHAAEREFLLALGEDDQFNRCHCNLAVVYHQMELYDAEEAALRQALAQDGTAVDACLGLALLRFDHGQTQSGLRHCENGLRVDPGHPRLWNLYGISRLRADGKELAWKPDGDPGWRECLPYLHVASALAWRQMVRAARTGRPGLVEKQRRVMTICLGNLALATAESGDLDSARPLFRQVLRAGDAPSWLAFELGRALYRAPARSRSERLRLLSEAEVALARVYDEALDGETRLELGLYLLGSQLALKQAAAKDLAAHETKAEFAYGYVVAQMAFNGEGEETRQRLERLIGEAKKPLRKLAAETDPWFERLLLLGRALDEISAPKRDETRGTDTSKEEAAYLALLRELSGDDPLQPGSKAERLLMRISDERDRGWFLSQVRIRLASVLPDEDLESAAQCLENAIHWLDKADHRLEIRKQGLFSRLAGVRLRQAGQSPVEQDRLYLLWKALDDARRAVAWNPQEAGGFLALGQVYAELGDWHQAREEWDKALSFEVGPEEWRAIATTCLRIADGPAARGRLVEDLLREGLKQVESRPAGAAEDGWLEAHGAIHLCLGLMGQAKGKEEAAEAAEYLEAARSMGYAATPPPPAPQAALAAATTS